MHHRGGGLLRRSQARISLVYRRPRYLYLTPPEGRMSAIGVPRSEMHAAFYLFFVLRAARGVEREAEGQRESTLSVDFLRGSVAIEKKRFHQSMLPEKV